jgi:hypothetical protein
LIESPDRLFGDAALRVVDEREAPRPACFPVYGKNDLRRFTDTRQVLSQLCLGRGVRQVADKQTN